MRPAFGCAVVTALLCLLAGRGWAAALEVSPVLVSLAPGQAVATVEVQNNDATPAAIQVRPFLWQQDADRDVLTPTDDIILSPPIFTVPAGASQTMRLLLRGGGAKGERSYRLLLDEVPQANATARQITIALRMSLPVIARSASSRTLAQATALQWRAERGADGQVMLTVLNTGSVYDKVNMIDVALPDGSHPKLTQQGQNPYVLPGAQRHWIMQGRNVASGTPLRLTVTTQAGKAEQTLIP